MITMGSLMGAWDLVSGSCISILFIFEELYFVLC